MDVVSLECPNCGGHVERKGSEYFVKCPYCGVEVAFDEIKEEAQIGGLKDKVSSLERMQDEQEAKRSALRKWILWRNILFGLMGAMHFCGFTCVGASEAGDPSMELVLGLGTVLCLFAWIMAIALPLAMASNYPAYDLLNGGTEVAGKPKACLKMFLMTFGILALSAFAAFIVLTIAGLT